MEIPKIGSKVSALEMVSNVDLSDQSDDLQPRSSSSASRGVSDRPDIRMSPFAGSKRKKSQDSSGLQSQAPIETPVSKKKGKHDIKVNIKIPDLRSS
jgi:hypothetical protein